MWRGRIHEHLYLRTDTHDSSPSKAGFAARSVDYTGAGPPSRSRGFHCGQRVLALECSNWPGFCSINGCESNRGSARP